MDAYNAHALDVLVACYAHDASLAYLSGEHATIQGKAAIRKAFAFLPGPPSAFHVEILQRVVTGPVVIDGERLHGLPPGKHLPDAFALYAVQAGLITKVWFPPAKWWIHRTGPQGSAAVAAAGARLSGASRASMASRKPAGNGNRPNQPRRVPDNTRNICPRVPGVRDNG